MKTKGEMTHSANDGRPATSAVPASPYRAIGQGCRNSNTNDLAFLRRVEHLLKKLDAVIGVGVRKRNIFDDVGLLTARELIHVHGASVSRNQNDVALRSRMHTIAVRLFEPLDGGTLLLAVHLGEPLVLDHDDRA